MVGASLGWRGSRGCRSLENRRYPRQHFVHDRVRNAFQLSSAAAHGEIESAGLVAADNSRRSGSGSRQRYGETCRAREIAAAGDGQNYGDFSERSQG